MSYYKAPGSLRWCELRSSETGQWHSILGPIASRWLDNDATLVTGVPEPRPSLLDDIMAKQDEIAAIGAKPAMRQRVLRNDPETVDEFVVHGCTVHLEQMGDGYYWIGIDRPEERPNGPTLHVDLVTRSRTGISCTVRDEEWDWDIDQTHP